MKLIFALGNPDKKYTGTRHNVGFWTVDSFSNKINAAFIMKSKFNAELADVIINGQKVLFAKPQTYYNDVGVSYRALIDYYDIAPTDSLVVHDELSLPIGTLRIREGGSDAGNNGIKSINLHGGQHSHRLRIGVANDKRSLIGDTDFVLGKFSTDENMLLETKLATPIHAFFDDFIAGRLSATSHTHRD